MALGALLLLGQLLLPLPGCAAGLPPGRCPGVLLALSSDRDLRIPSASSC